MVVRRGGLPTSCCRKSGWRQAAEVRGAADIFIFIFKMHVYFNEINIQTPFCDLGHPVLEGSINRRATSEPRLHNLLRVIRNRYPRLVSGTGSGRGRFSYC